MRMIQLGMTSVVLAAMLSGCGGDDSNSPIEKSPNAPSPDQIKAMEKEAMKNMNPKGSSKRP